MRTWLWVFSLGLLAVWPARWLVQGFPADLLAVEGGGAWPVHLLAEATVAGLCMVAARRASRPALLLALGMLIYGSVNNLSYGVYGSFWHVGIAAAKAVTAAVLIWMLVAQPQAQRRPRAWWPGLVVALVGAGMIGFWALQTAVAGIMKDGIMTAEGNGYLIFHLIAEDAAGSLAVLGGIGLLLRIRHTVGLTLVGAGAVLYAALNSFGWAIRNDAALGAVFVICSLAMILAAAGLWRVSAGAPTGGRRAA